MNKRSYVAAAFVLATIVGVRLADAHHAANVMYDLDSPVLTMQGVLTRYANVNPHTRIEFDTTDREGKRTNWSVTAPSPSGMRGLGVNAKDDMVVGRTYTFRVIRARDGSDYGLLLGMILPDGRNITIRLTPAERGERANG
jgi:hypothetical protein